MMNLVHHGISAIAQTRWVETLTVVGRAETGAIAANAGRDGSNRSNSSDGNGSAISDGGNRSDGTEGRDGGNGGDGS